MTKIGRNDPCPCGSGRKHKSCCLGGGAADPRPAAEAPRSGHAPPRRLSEARDREHDELLAEYFDTDAADHDKAEAVAQKLLERFPELIDGHERLAEVYAARGEPLRAADHYRLAAALMIPAEPNYDPAYVPYLLYSADKLEREARGVRPSELDEYSESVAGDIIRGDLADAELGIADLSLRCPGHYVIDERRGQLAEVRRDFKAAAHHFRAAADRASIYGAPLWYVAYLRGRAAVLDPVPRPAAES